MIEPPAVHGQWLANPTDTNLRRKPRKSGVIRVVKKLGLPLSRAFPCLAPWYGSQGLLGGFQGTFPGFAEDVATFRPVVDDLEPSKSRKGKRSPTVGDGGTLWSTRNVGLLLN